MENAKGARGSGKTSKRGGGGAGENWRRRVRAGSIRYLQDPCYLRKVA